MEVKVKRLSKNSVIPQYSHCGDAGMDLTATDMYFENGNIVYHTGLAFEIPKGYVGLVFPRSSNAKKDLILTNSVGVIDSGYRGEVLAKFKPINSCKEFYQVGDRICQLIILPYPTIELTEVEELSDTERGSGGYGSTGK